MDYKTLEQQLQDYPLTYKQLRIRLKEYVSLKEGISDELFLGLNDFYDYVWAQEVNKYFKDNGLNIQDYINYIKEQNKLPE